VAIARMLTATYRDGHIHLGHARKVPNRPRSGPCPRMSSWHAAPLANHRWMAVSETPSNSAGRWATPAHRRRGRCPAGADGGGQRPL